MQHKFIIKIIFALISFFITTLAIAQTHTLVQGWNLEGNDNGAAVDPNAIFGNATTPTTVSPSVTTVWAWDKNAGIWNFFAPSMTPAALATYAASKGYGVLTTISQGQGFWVNAKNAVSVNLTATVSTATVAATCTPSNFTIEKYNSIALGMSMAQVEQIIGCAYDPNYIIRAVATNVTYRWGFSSIDNNGNSTVMQITVDFDSTGSTVTYLANLAGYGFKEAAGF